MFGIRFLRYIAIALSTGLVPAAMPEPAVEILRTGLYHGNEVSAEAGPDWWGIFPEGDGFTLQTAPVTISIAHDGIIDDVGQMTGKQVTVPQEAEPVLLIRGLKNPVQGPLQALLNLPRDTYLFPGQSLYLDFNGTEPPRCPHLVALGATRERPGISGVQIIDYQLKLRLDGRSQTIAALPETSADSKPRLLWAGDLDRDGQLDLLFDLTDHYNVVQLTLFLSSVAQEGEFVRKVAEWRTTGC